MTITENIVRMMNGSIDVQSELGKGSRFTVSVPLELCLEKEEYGDELSGLPVLVVDDDKITCKAQRHCLMNWECAGTGSCLEGKPSIL